MDAADSARTGSRVASPCISVCVMDPATGLCCGCLRTLDEIARWSAIDDDARRAMGGTVFWRALRGYLADHRWGLAHSRTLLDALDAATPLDMAGRWRSRFPSLY